MVMRVCVICQCEFDAYSSNVKACSIAHKAIVKRERQKKYAMKYPEKVRLARRNHYLKYPEKKKEYGKRWREKNLERHRELNKKNRLLNIEKEREQHRTYYLKHREKI